MRVHTSSGLVASCPVSKKLEEKQQRRLEEERKRQQQTQAARKRNLMTLAIAALVATLVVALIIMERPEEVSDDFGVASDESGCTDIETFEDEGRGHIDEGSPLSYKTQPPTSGEHYPSVADGGFSSEPVNEGNVVHNLEHGQIVIWYDPQAPGSVLEDIETYVDDAGLPMLAVPYESVPSGYNFTIGAWGATQSCEDVSGEVLGGFRERFQGKGPEQVGIETYNAGS